MSQVNVIAQEEGMDWKAYNADCVAVLSGLPDNSIHYQISSPPFISLYTFSDKIQDVSNCQDDATFWDHMKFIIRELYRVIKPGRLSTMHCMLLPTSIQRDGYIGLRDFRGDLIKAHQESGWIFHSEVVIAKSAVSAMMRTKAIGLLHKQLVKDSSFSRMAIPDYMITFRKPGENTEPITGMMDTYYNDEMTDEELTADAYRTFHGQDISDAKALEYAAEWGIVKAPKEAIAEVKKILADSAKQRTFEQHKSIHIWQRVAEPIWTDIHQSDVLSHRLAREEHDERHISPIQLTPVRRCIDLWTNPGDIVFSPFTGIGTAGYVAIEMGRRFVGAELKPSYYRQAVANLKLAERERGASDLFGAMNYQESSA
jgi:DNA modification methylase